MRRKAGNDDETITPVMVDLNLWNTSCGACVAEMPALQNFHEKLEADPEVVVLTVSNDPNPDSVREWMEKNEYDFAVLIDDGYVDRE